MTSILISGGSGAFGRAFVRHLLSVNRYERIVIYSRGEYQQFLMSQALAPFDIYQSMRFMIGDVRDSERLKRALHGINHVVHAAALKRIEVGNYNPVEMVKTNVGGAINLIEAAQDSGVKKVVALSTDKAFQPVSPYGTSKALAESILLAANNTTGWYGPKFSVCRYGNVWGSTGSVVPTWRRLLKDVDTVPVTDPDCTRFFMRMDEAICLVLSTIESNEVGKIAIPHLPAYRLGDLAEAMGAKMNITGLPPWEKKHESMTFENSSDTAKRMTVAELKQELAND